VAFLLKRQGVVFAVAASTDVSYDLLVSFSPDRSNAAKLDGITVRGNMFVFTSPDVDVTKVTFFVDDPGMTGTGYSKVENRAPYDLAGTDLHTSGRPALPFDTTGLADGSHQITTRIQLSDETNNVLNGTFTVANATPPETTLDLSTTQLDFGEEEIGTTSDAKKVVLTNIGNVPLSIGSITTSGDFFPCASDCGSSLEVFASCTQHVKFLPTATGVRAGEMTIDDSASGSPHKVLLSGIGTDDPTSLDSQPLCANLTPNRRVGTVAELHSILKTLRPGDVLEIAKGTYNLPKYTGKAWPEYTIVGTDSNPIVICGAGTRATWIESNASVGAALVLSGSSNVTIANLVITHPDQQGIDGRTQRACTRNAKDPDCTNKNEEGIILRNGTHHVTIRENVFRKIGTRGVLINNRDNDHNTIELNIFTDVGNNTASGDINVNGGVATIYGNLLAGNTDGFVVDGSNEVGHLVARNLCANHWQENCIDLKSHDSGRNGEEFSIVRDNVMHANRLTKENTFHFSNGTRWVRVFDNQIETPLVDGRRAILVLGREALTGDLDVYRNCFVGSTSSSTTGVRGTERGAAVRNVRVHDNTFVSVNTPISGPGVIDLGGNAMHANRCPAPIEGLEQSILEELGQYFTTTEIAAALAGSGLSYTP
jgi:hypothetical protein